MNQVLAEEFPDLVLEARPGSNDWRIRSRKTGSMLDVSSLELRAAIHGGQTDVHKVLRAHALRLMGEVEGKTLSQYFLWPPAIWERGAP